MANRAKREKRKRNEAHAEKIAAKRKSQPEKKKSAKAARQSAGAKGAIAQW